MTPVQRQRTILCDLLDSLSDEQWSAETMCEGWDAGDMCGHLLVRERQPWNAVGIVVPPLAGLHDKAMERKKREGRAKLVADLRDGPPWLFRKGPMGDVQVGEDYIHTEDIRRGVAAGVTGATLTPDDGTDEPRRAKLLWQGVSRFSRMTLGGLDADGVITLTDGTTSRSYTVGGKLAKPCKDIPRGAEQYTVTGPVGDLLLYVTGRSQTDVTTAGSPVIEQALANSRRGV